MSEVRDPEVFRAVLDSLPVGVYIEDRNGTILFWNQSAERITGHRRYEVIGHSQRENILAQCDGLSCPGCGKKCPFQESSIDSREQELRLSLRHKNGPWLILCPALYRGRSAGRSHHHGGAGWTAKRKSDTR